MVEVVPMGLLKGLDGKAGVAFQPRQVAVNKACSVVAVAGLRRGLAIAHLLNAATVEWQCVDDDDIEVGDECTVVSGMPDDAAVSVPNVATSRRGGTFQGTFVAGYKYGWLRWFGSDGRRTMAHKLHDAPVLQLKTVGAHDVLALHEGGVLVALRTGGPKLSFQKYELEGQRIINDVLGISGGPVLDPWATHPLRKGCVLHVIGLGAYPMLGAYLPSDRQGLVSNIASAVFSMAKSWWSSGASTAEASPAAKGPAEAHPQDMEWGVEDSTREFLSFVASPSMAMAAATDNLGRVLLFDLRSFCMVRMWKGFREAQCAFLDGGKYLAIYAPRRGVLEVWRMRHGQREALMEVGLGLTLAPSGHLLRGATGELQVVRYSSALAEHWKRDSEAMALVKQAAAAGQPLVPFLQQMRHPKLLVKAVLALPPSSSSSAFLEAVNAALEQCGHGGGGQQQQQQSGATPGFATRVATQDVTHLIWLSAYIRAYRVLEGTDTATLRASDGGDAPDEDGPDSASAVAATTTISMSCRQFLRCFSVHDGSEAHLSRELAPDTQAALAHFVFGALSARRIAHALRLARLASADAETLLADYVLCANAPPAQRVARLLGSIQVRRRDVAGGEATLALAVLHKRVQSSHHLDAALAVAHILSWEEACAQLALLRQVPGVSVSINDAVRGPFSVFQLLAAAPDDARLRAVFPQHAALTSMVAAHACLLQCIVTSANNAAEAGADTINQSFDASSAAAAAADEEYLDDDAPSPLLADALATLRRIDGDVALRGAIALWCWQHRLAPLFWRCAQLVDVAGRTPSRRTALRALQLNIAEVRQLCFVVRDWVAVALDAWAVRNGGAAAQTPVPFPSQLDPNVNAARAEWDRRDAALGADLRQAVLVARVMLAVFKHHVRGVHVLCVLPVASRLRELVQPADEVRGRFSSNVEFQRKELVLRLMPANSSMATQLAKDLDMDMVAIRKSAAAVLTATQ